jgi:HK97 family phage prohead protease
VEATLLKTLSVPLTLKDGDIGEFEAVFSTFDVVDLDGDIVKRSAITEGQKIPLLWGHDSGSMPIATGVVHTTDKHAVVRGQFIDSTAGRDAHQTVKATAGMQELSWGFQITEANDVAKDGKTYREISGTDMFEASFVLRGAAGPGRTGVTGIKTTLKDQIDQASKAVREAIDRAKEVSRLRFDEGKTLGVESAESLQNLYKDLQEVENLITGLSDQRNSEDELTVMALNLQARQRESDRLALGEQN